MNREEYKGKRVFIGIDVHLRQYTVCCICEGLVVKRASMPGYPAEMVRFIANYFEGAEVKTAYEAGFSGLALHRTLAKAGIKNVVVHAASIEVSTKKTKTDKRDAQKIAEHLAAGKFKEGIRIASEEEEIGRLVSRTRAQHSKARARIKNQIRMRLHYFGLIDLLEKRAMSHKMLKEMREKGLPAGLDLMLKSQEDVWRALDVQIKACDSALELQTSGTVAQLYLTVPGVGRLIAATLTQELGDMSQFKSEKELFSFTGLVPGEHTSDEARHLGHITREGSSRIRHLLVQAAWKALEQDSTLRGAFLRISARAGRKRAIVAIARKLIGRARAVVRKREDYKVPELKLAA